VIELSHVTMQYKTGASVLTDVSLRVEKGEFVVLTGPSGAGKSTLLKLLYAAERPTRGLVLVDGVNVPRLPPRELPRFRRRLGVVFQDFRLLDGQTVFENLALVLDAAGASRKTIAVRVQATVTRLGIQSALRERVENLSGGEQQRVAIARALVNDPLLLLADEPTGNLDAESTGWVVRLLQEASVRGTTVVVATHDAALTAALHRRVIAVDRGRIARPAYRGVVA
jgi:cell division transport system ATP-binding protein